jgi:hypothetical protein
VCAYVLCGYCMDGLVACGLCFLWILLTHCWLLVAIITSNKQGPGHITTTTTEELELELELELGMVL